jgi:hypothetical protein
MSEGTRRLGSGGVRPKKRLRAVVARLLGRHSRRKASPPSGQRTTRRRHRGRRPARKPSALPDVGSWRSGTPRCLLANGSAVVPASRWQSRSRERVWASGTPSSARRRTQGGRASDARSPQVWDGASDCERGRLAPQAGALSARARTTSDRCCRAVEPLSPPSREGRWRPRAPRQGTLFERAAEDPATAREPGRPPRGDREWRPRQDPSDGNPSNARLPGGTCETLAPASKAPGGLLRERTRRAAARPLCSRREGVSERLPPWYAEILTARSRKVPPRTASEA